MKISLFDYVQYKPFAAWGLDGAFWTLHVDTILHTWAAMAIIIFLGLLGRWSLRRDKSLLYYAYQSAIQFFIDLCKETLKSGEYNYVLFMGSIFLFTGINCIVGVIPFLDESTKDLNTTFALALVCFAYITGQKIKMHGLRGYLREYIEPSFFLTPIHLVGELSKIASMSFRLFGNILGGNVILSIIIGSVATYKEIYIALVIFSYVFSFIVSVSKLGRRFSMIHRLDRFLYIAAHLVTFIQLIFGIIEGLVQSFVLMMLTATYLSMSMTPEEEQPAPPDNQSPEELHVEEKAL